MAFSSHNIYVANADLYAGPVLVFTKYSHVSGTNAYAGMWYSQGFLDLVGELPDYNDVEITYNSDGTIATVEQDGVLTAFTYAGGRITQDTVNGLVRTYVYDIDGRFVRMEVE